MTRHQAVPEVRGRAGGFLLCCLLCLALACSYTQLEKPMDESDIRAFRRIESRLGRAETLEGSGTVTFSRANQDIVIPFSMSISKDLVITLDAEVRHFLLPFEGTTSLHSLPDRTMVKTSMGIFDLGRMGHSHSAVRAGLLSALAGGDRLLLWVKSRGRRIGREVECDDLSIKLDPDETGYFIDSWEVETGDGTTLKASIDDLEPGPDRLPRHITGMVEPDGISVELEFEDIRLSDEPPNEGIIYHDAQ